MTPTRARAAPKPPIKVSVNWCKESFIGGKTLDNPRESFSKRKKTKSQILARTKLSASSPSREKMLETHR